MVKFRPGKQRKQNSVIAVVNLLRRRKEELKRQEVTG